MQSNNDNLTAIYSFKESDIVQHSSSDDERSSRYEDNHLKDISSKSNTTTTTSTKLKNQINEYNRKILKLKRKPKVINSLESCENKIPSKNLETTSEISENHIKSSENKVPGKRRRLFNPAAQFQNQNPGKEVEKPTKIMSVYDYGSNDETIPATNSNYGEDDDNLVNNYHQRRYHNGTSGTINSMSTLCNMGNSCYLNSGKYSNVFTINLHLK